MHIILNNREEIIENKNKISFEDLIKYKNFTFRSIVTKLNNKLVKKEARKETYIQENDNVVVLHLISGG